MNNKILPIGWSLSRGENLFDLIRGVTFKKIEASEQPHDDYVAILRAGNLQNGQILFVNLVYVPSDYVSENQKIRKHDLIIAMSSGSKNIVGKAAAVPSDFKNTSFGAFCGLLRPLSLETADWLKHFLQTKEYRKYVSDIASGININNLRREHLLNLNIPFAPLNEQKRIAEKLESLQSRSNKARKALEAIPPLLEKFRQSVLSSAFRGDLTADWRAQNPNIEPAAKLLERIRKERRKRWEEAELAKMKAKNKTPKDDKWKKKYKEPEPVDTTDLPELPEGWCWVALEELSEKVTDGTHQPPPFADLGVPFLVIRNIIKGVIDWEGVGKWVTESTHEKFTSNSKPEKGDVLYSAVGSYGVAVEVQEDRKFMFQRHIAHIKPVKSVVLPTFIMLSLNSPYSLAQAHKVARGVAQKTVTLTFLRRFKLALPPEKEQYEIIERVKKALHLSESAKDFVRKSTLQVEQLDQSILAKAFRGKLVPQDPNDEPASQLLERIQQEKASLEAAKS